MLILIFIVSFIDNLMGTCFEYMYNTSINVSVKYSKIFTLLSFAMYRFKFKYVQIFLKGFVFKMCMSIDR